MTLKLAMLLTADAKQAKSEVVGTAKAVKGLGDATVTAGKNSKAAAGGTQTLGAAAGSAATKVKVLSAAEAQAAATAGALSQANRVAAGSMGNLIAQFNDIGVMMAAGQNPLQLALQQGTQITQVIGPMGAAGAVKALGGAFLGMLNPISLATIAIIGGGAALTQWAFSADDAEESADDLTEALKALSEESRTARDEVVLFKTGLDNIEQFKVIKEIEKLELALAQIKARDSIVPRRSNAGANPEATVLEAEIAALQDALELRNQTVAASKQLKDAQERVNAGIENFLTGAITAADKYLTLQQSVDSTVSALEAQANIQSLVNQFGEESLQVATARAAEERRVYEEVSLTAEMSEVMKQEIMAAWDGAKGVASVDMAGNITLAADAAAVLAARLASSQAMINAARNNPDYFDPRNESGLAGETNPDRYDVPLGLPGVTLPPNPRTPRKRRGGRSGGGRAAEINEVERLTDRLQQELDILRETDPVQKELIRNRETLAKASDAERVKVEELIRQRHAETQAIERLTERQDFMRSIGENALDSLIAKGESFGDVLKNIVVQLIDAAIQAQIFGSGPFGGGTSGEYVVNAKSTARNRHALDMINAGAVIPAFASGGAVGRSGTGSSSSANANGGPMHVTMDLSGARGDREIEEAGYRGMQRALDEYDRQSLPGRVNQINQNPRMVG